MKIGINSRLYQNAKTGIPYYIEKLYTTCQALDKNNEYVFFQTDSKRTLGKTSVKSLNNSLLSAFLFDNFLINSLINRNQVSVFHGPSGILPFFKKKKIKYIVTVHDLSFLVFPENQSKLFNLYYKYFVGRSLHGADYVVADSFNTKKDIMKYYGTPESKIRVIHLGVDPTLYKKSTKRLIEKKYFFTLSTHPKRKNIYRVIDLMAENPELTKLTFVIAGLIPPDQKYELIKIIQEKNLSKNIIIYGYASEEDLVSLYHHAEFFIYPTLYEGFGFPIIEAMIAHCPVLASNTSSIPEIVPSKEWLFDPYNSQEIGNIMFKMLNLSREKRLRMIQTNYQYAKQFTWKKTAQAMISLYIS